jgi:hypothetical protein
MLILFFTSPSTCWMMTEAIVNWLVLFLGWFLLHLSTMLAADTVTMNNADPVFFPTSFDLFHDNWGNGQLIALIFPVSTYSISCTLEPFCFFHDSWDNGWLVRFFLASLCAYSILCTLDPTMGPSVYWDCLLIKQFGVVLCRDNRQWGNKESCLLSSTDQCSAPALLLSDGTLHVFSANVDALCPREPELKCRASDVIVSDVFSLCLIWSLPLVLRSALLMIIACDVNTT